MKSKIIKVSIILIFMMFSAGLFNFCFALEYTNFIEGGGIPLKSVETDNAGNSISILKNAILLPKYNEPSFDNIVGSPDFSGLVSPTTKESVYTNNINNHKYILYLYNGQDGYQLFCDVPINDGFVFTIKKVGFVDIFLTELYKPNVISSVVRLVYDFDNNCWNVGYKYNNTPLKPQSFEYTISGEFYLIESYIDIYHSVKNATSFDSSRLIYDAPEYVEPIPEPSIKMEVNQTGSKTGHVTFTSENWDSHMYYIKDDMDELVRLIAEEELSPIHDKVKLYNGPIAIDYGEYVMGLLFDSNGTMIFSEISNTLELDSDIMFDDTHRLRIDKSDLDTYYLFIHSPQEGDYIKVSSVPNTASDFNNEAVIINGAMTYNGLSIRNSFINGFNQLTREINITKNTVNYFYLYDINNNLVDSVVLNTSNYYDGSFFDFDVDLSYGNNKFDTNHEGLLSFLNNYFNIVSATEALSRYNHTCWVKVIPTIDVPSIDNYELYLRVSDYGSLEYIDEEDRNIFMSHDNLLTNNIGVGIGLNSNTNWHRIDDKIYDYFYLATLQDNDAKFTFELQLRSASGQVIETKTFKINLSANNKAQGTVSSSTNGKDDTYVRNPDELSGIVSSSNKFDFSGLNNLTEQELKTNVEGLIDSSIGFFGLFSTIFLLLPTWVSSLLYLFFFGMIVITLLRFIRGS